MTTGDEKKWYDQTFWYRFLPRGAVACGLVLMWRAPALARCGEDSRDYRACGRGGAVVPNVPSRGGCARDDGA